MVNVGIFYDHLEYFMAIWYYLWPFIIHSLWSFVVFPNLVCLDQEKSGNPDGDILKGGTLITTLETGTKNFVSKMETHQSQGCQIFLATIYQHGENVPKHHKIC
jgi:hypothetical protein